MSFFLTYSKFKIIRVKKVTDGILKKLDKEGEVSNRF